jgi:hypothetical protein
MENQFSEIVVCNKTTSNSVVDESVNVVPVINKISNDDERYCILQTIPEKEKHGESTIVYLWINDEKDYYIVYIDFEIQVQILSYEGNLIRRIDADLYEIK